jgi:acetaldehyde dehydrogenase (acetylating)
MTSTAAALDADLAAILDARLKARAARTAFELFEGADQARIDAIVRAMARAGTDAAEELARLAVDETGYGVFEDKIVKNLYNTRVVADALLAMRTVGVLWVDEAARTTAVGCPVGVVAGIIPVTNPTSTVLFKILASVKAGNAIVCAPHPRAARCCNRAARILAEAAERAGAPPGLVSCLEQPTLSATRELMTHDAVTMILATGGADMVRACYSAGKPTIAVGAGNVPCYIDRSVPDLTEAAVMVVTSKSFDNGTACVAEQAVVIDEPVAPAYEAALEAAGCAFVEPPHHRALATLFFTERGGLRPEAVGQSAVELARRAGFSVPPSTRVLGVRLDTVGRQAPLSAEILGPVLKVYRVAGADQGWQRCREILAFGGEGHTLALHAADPDVIARFSALPASRVLVNTPALFGGMGYSTGIDPSFVLGTGTWSGSIASDNITALHLINIKRVAHEVRPWRGALALSGRSRNGVARAV